MQRPFRLAINMYGKCINTYILHLFHIVIIYCFHLDLCLASKVKRANKRSKNERKIVMEIKDLIILAANAKRMFDLNFMQNICILTAFSCAIISATEIVRYFV